MESMNFIISLIAIYFLQQVLTESQFHTWTSRGKVQAKRDLRRKSQSEEQQKKYKWMSKQSLKHGKFMMNNKKSQLCHKHLDYNFIFLNVFI